GGIVARMTGDIDAISGLVSSGLLELVSSGITVIGVAIVLVALDWRLALASLTVTPILAAAVAWFRNGSGTAWRQVRQTASAGARGPHGVAEYLPRRPRDPGQPPGDRNPEYSRRGTRRCAQGRPPHSRPGRVVLPRRGIHQCAGNRRRDRLRRPAGSGRATRD